MLSTLEAAPVRQRWLPWELREIAFFAQMAKGVIWLRGPGRSGKTGTAMNIAWKLRKYFNKMPILDFHPKDAFGSHHYVGPREFVKLMGKMGDLVDKGNIEGMASDQVKALIEAELGFPLENSTWVLDEAYRYLRNRHPSSKLVLAYGDFIATWGHYHLTIILCSPGLELDKRVVKDQLPIELNCQFNGEKVLARGRNAETCRAVKLITPMDWAGQLYDSENAMAILRSEKIEVKGL